MNVICLILLIIAGSFASLLVDFNVIPKHIFRPVVNACFLLFGVYQLFRIRMKTVEGVFEKLQKEYEQLSNQVEESRYQTLRSEVDDLKKRIAEMEKKG